MHLFSNLLLSALGGLALMACSTVNPVTLARLSQVNPLETDPALYRVLANLPEGLDVKKGSSQLVLSMTLEGETQVNEFTLQHLDKGGVQELAVAEEDLERLRALQALARQAKLQNPGGSSGSLSASVGLCTVNGGPDPDDEISIDLVMDGQTALPLVRSLSVSRYLAEIEKKAVEPLQPCP